MSRPKSLFTPSAVSSAVLEREQAEAIAKKVLALTTMETQVIVVSGNTRTTRFGRSEITTQKDGATGEIVVSSTNGTRGAEFRTQRFDDEGIREAVKGAEDAARQGPPNQSTIRPVKGPRTYPTPPGLWSDATLGVGVEQRVEAVASAIDKAEGYSTAGSLDVLSASEIIMNTKGLTAWSRFSKTRFTMTARSLDNTASGWAGQELYDFNHLRADDVAARAVDKAARSRNPSAVEPGRWTVIMEPAAYAEMMYDLMHWHWGLEEAERGTNVWTDGKGGTKIGRKVIDERLNIISDPSDPDGPFVPFGTTGIPYDRTEWIKDGVLKALSQKYEHSDKLGLEYPITVPEDMRLEAKPGTKLQTLEEMVATCERGIYVTRLTASFSNFRFGTFTGVTRDGTWLVEKGKVTRPIKNMRYLDSPVFFLNSLDAVGKPELVPISSQQLVIPPIRVRDFHFTAIADAV